MRLGIIWIVLAAMFLYTMTVVSGKFTCASCYSDPTERTYALGPIFRTVFWHSITGATLIGTIVLLQVYVFP